MTTSDTPSLGKTQLAVLTAAARHGLFRVSSAWRAKGIRNAIPTATVDALVRLGYLRLDGEAATVTDRGRDASRRLSGRKPATAADGEG